MRDGPSPEFKRQTDLHAEIEYAMRGAGEALEALSKARGKLMEHDFRGASLEMAGAGGRFALIARMLEKAARR